MQTAYVASAAIGVPPVMTLMLMSLCGCELELAASTGTARPSLREVVSFKNWARGKPRYGSYMAISVAIMAVCMLVLDATLRTYTIPLALRADLGFTKLHAALLLTAYNVAAILGRGGGGLLSLAAPPQVLTNVFVFLSLVSVIGAALFALQEALSLWIWVILIGVLTAPLFPAVLGWTDQYIKVTGVAMMALEVGKGAGVVIMNAVSGHLLTHSTPQAIMYYMLSAGILLVVTFLPAEIVSAKIGNRFKGDSHSTALPDPVQCNEENDERKQCIGDTQYD